MLPRGMASSTWPGRRYTDPGLASAKPDLLTELVEAHSSPRKVREFICDARQMHLRHVRYSVEACCNRHDVGSLGLWRVAFKFVTRIPNEPSQYSLRTSVGGGVAHPSKSSTDEDRDCSVSVFWPVFLGRRSLCTLVSRVGNRSICDPFRRPDRATLVRFTIQEMTRWIAIGIVGGTLEACQYIANRDRHQAMPVSLAAGYAMPS